MKKKWILFLLSLILLLTFINGVSAENSTIELNINTEYNENINPEISITHNNTNIEYTKTVTASKYQITANNITTNQSYSLTISEPGYYSEIQNITFDSKTIQTFNFNLKATPTYKLGYEATVNADKILHFSSADEVLVITTAGMTRINGVTSENALEGIINAAKGYITYGQGNILTLSATRNDPTNFAFITKKGNSLTMAFFKNESKKPIYYGTAGPELNYNQWKTLQELLGNEDAYSYISIANAWSAGMPKDILTQATYHGHVCTGLISGQAMIQTLLTHYPPRDEFGLPLENTAYYVISVPGGSDDDAFTWTMDITPGKRAYIGIDTMTDKTMTGFIRWNQTSKTGILIIMSYNEENIKNQFKSIYGLNPDISATNDLKYQNWLINKLQTNPSSLINILYEFKGLNYDSLVYLMGEEIGKGNVTKSAHGLDMDYILNLKLENSICETSHSQHLTKLTENQLKQIGIDASNMAINYFNSIGINMEKDYSRLYVLTSAGYVRVNNTSTSMVFDGITEVLGSTLSRKTLLPVHTSLWKDLVFDFFWVDSANNKNTASFSLKYNPTLDKLIVTGNSSETKTKANYIIQQVLKYDPPYDALISWLFHNHVCGGSSPGYLISDHIYNELPLKENESYIYITTNDNCKDDVISRLLGVSPGMGSYYNLRYDNSITNSTNVGIAIKWNSFTKTGELIIIDYKGPKFKKGSDSYEEYIKLYKGDYSSSNIITLPIVTSVAKKEINEEMLQNIISGGKQTKQGNALDYIRSLDNTLPIKPSNPNAQTNGTTTNTEESATTTNSQGARQNIGSKGYIAINSQGTDNNVGDSSNTPISGDNDDSNNGNKENTGKSYEISKKPVTKEVNSNTIIYAIAIVLILGIIAGYGYLKSKK